MSVSTISTLEMEAEMFISHGPTESLSLVDVESYPPFIGKEADGLDLMVHLSNQMNALTAFSWDVPRQPLVLRFFLTGNHQAMERITFFNRPPSASGTIRTQGRLCLLGHDQLLDWARNSARGLFANPSVRSGECLHEFKVPPGILYVMAYYRLSYSLGARPENLETKDEYTIFLHHYPHPAPRIAPVRLTGGLIPWAGEGAAGQAWGGHGG